MPGQRGARWQSGYAAACKAVDAGSIPTLASIYLWVYSGHMVYTLSLTIDTILALIQECQMVHHAEFLNFDRQHGDCA